VVQHRTVSLGLSKLVFEVSFEACMLGLSVLEVELCMLVEEPLWMEQHRLGLVGQCRQDLELEEL